LADNKDSLIIIKVMGGLGNQMQQYSLYTKFLRMGLNARLDLSWFDESNQEGVLARRACELKYFLDLPIIECTDDERNYFLNRSAITKGIERLFSGGSRIFRESEMFHPEVLEFTKKYLEGYFLCPKYYEELFDELKGLFVFPCHTNDKYRVINMDVKNEMLQRNSISIHFRRGDYLDKENMLLFGGITTDEYYESAINYCKASLSDPHFYIFSDDPDYARDRFSNRENCEIIDWNTGKNAMLDIELMSCCRANICANSTFSLWGGRLNRRSDAIRIRPLAMRNDQATTPAQMHYYWRDWMLFDRKGNGV